MKTDLGGESSRSPIDNDADRERVTSEDSENRLRYSGLISDIPVDVTVDRFPNPPRALSHDSHVASIHLMANSPRAVTGLSVNPQPDLGRFLADSRFSGPVPRCPVCRIVGLVRISAATRGGYGVCSVCGEWDEWGEYGGFRRREWREYCEYREQCEYCE